MAVSRRVTAAACGMTTIAGLLTAMVLTPVVAGAALAASPAAGGCTATATVDSQWGGGPTGGQIVTVTVANTSLTVASKWTVRWGLASGQRVVSGWRATVSTS